MGFHHMYDNANVAECLWMLAEIEEHMFGILEDARVRQRENNEKRRKRRKIADAQEGGETKEGEDEDEVSSDTDVGSNADYLSVHSSDIDSDLDEDKREETKWTLMGERAERTGREPLDPNHKSYANG